MHQERRPDQPSLPTVLEHPTSLRRECRKERYKDSNVCRALRAVPGGGGGPIDPGDLPDLPTLPLGRTGPGSSEETMTLDRLMGAYNPILVGLLLPGVAE